MDTISGSMRLTFDLQDLIRGVSFLVVVIGIFGIAELLETMQNPVSARPVATGIDLAGVLRAAGQWIGYRWALLRSALIGAGWGSRPEDRPQPPS